MARDYSRTHDLKIQQCYLDNILSGRKRFEIRRNDRDFQVGDWMKLQSIDGTNGVQCKIIYISSYEQKEGFVVIGFTIGDEK